MDIELKINLKDYIKVRDCLKWLSDEGGEHLGPSGHKDVNEAFEIVDKLIPVDNQKKDLKIQEIETIIRKNILEDSPFVKKLLEKDVERALQAENTDEKTTEID